MTKVEKQKRFKKIIIILGIIILPLIYSLFYLKGFWDPYNSLNEVPVAIVNEDNCQKNCKSTELIKQLKEKDVLKLQETTWKKANNGLINKDYYAIIKIPEDFTKSFENAKNKNRSETTITYTPNTKTNYLASQIIGTAVKEIQSELNQTTNKEIVATLTQNLQNVPYQTKQISDGLGQIQNGSKKLKQGTETLQNGTSKLNKNYQTFDNGISKINQGTIKLKESYQTLDNGISKIYNGAHTLKLKTENLTALAPKVQELKNGQTTLTNSLKDFETSQNQMLTNTETAYNSIINYVNNNPEAKQDPNIIAAYQIALAYTSPDETGLNGLNKLKYGINKIQTGANKIETSLNTMYQTTKSLNTLKSGIDELESSLKVLKNGSSATLNGINTLDNGLNTLKTNSTKIKTGITAINSGTTSLKSGTKELNNSLETAKNKTDDKIKETKKETDQLEGLDSYAKTPVKVSEKDYGNVTQYGTFFSPYFMSLSLWVGGILILMGLYYDPDNRFKVLGRHSENRGKRLVFYNIIGVIQAIILAFILKLLLGFTVTNIPLYYLSCILISEAFLAIIMFLFFNFKDVGKFLAIVFLVLQLAACGGTFPIETEPTIYQAIYKFMPMTYSVNLLRESFVNINNSLLTKNILILLGIFIVFTIIIFITGYIKNKKAIN